MAEVCKRARKEAERFWLSTATCFSKQDRTHTDRDMMELVLKALPYNGKERDSSVKKKVVDPLIPNTSSTSNFKSLG
jgi:hypothetical protein